MSSLLRSRFTWQIKTTLYLAVDTIIPKDLSLLSRMTYPEGFYRGLD